MLDAIRREADRVVGEKWELGKGALRMYVHYQPSYCELPVTTICLSKDLICMLLLIDHFHVHIVNANQAGMMGMAVGQAHLLDDIISLVRIRILNVCRSRGSNGSNDSVA